MKNIEERTAQETLERFCAVLYAKFVKSINSEVTSEPSLTPSSRNEAVK